MGHAGGSIDLQVPKLRQGSYFPGWLLERRRRAEAALASVVATSYLLGVSTRRVEKLTQQLGNTSLSKSQVSEMANDLHAQAEAFRTWPLDAGPYTFVVADALVLMVREAGRTVKVHAMLATGVNVEGYREILGLQVSSAEDGAGWLAFLRDLSARRPVRRRAGDFRRTPRADRGDRRDAALRRLAAMPHALNP